MQKICIDPKRLYVERVTLNTCSSKLTFPCWEHADWQLLASGWIYFITKELLQLVSAAFCLLSTAPWPNLTAVLPWIASSHGKCLAGLWSLWSLFFVSLLFHFLRCSRRSSRLICFSSLGELFAHNEPLRQCRDLEQLYRGAGGAGSGAAVGAEASGGGVG